VIGIVESRADEASEHVCEHLRRLGDFEERTDDDRPDADGGGTVWRSDEFELRSFDDLHIYLEDPAAAFDDPELLVFASRHSGDTGPLLSAHPTGNFGDAEFGGEARSLARAPPNALATVLDALAEHAPPAYDVGMECTHHGPTEIEPPSMFVELGSGPEEWADDAGAEALARAILDLEGVPADAAAEAADAAPEAAAATSEATDPPAHAGRRRHLVGFGGGHYAPRFTRIARETDWAVGHVAADWSLEELGDPAANRDVVAQVFEASVAGVAVIEGDRPDLVAAIEALGFRVASETWVRETGGVSLALVEVAEERLGTVEEGLRFGAPAGTLGDSMAALGDSMAALGDPAAAPGSHGGADAGVDPDDLSTLAHPSDLLDAAAGIDREATMAAIDETCVAYLTAEGGTRPGERALVADDGVPDQLVGRLAAILRERFDSIAVEADRIVAEETAFDPTLAAEAGVPEGPAFGKLSSGEPVEVDGTTVAPEDVHERRRVAFDLPSIEDGD
jgi:D-aminoacyl-tRNA deacylase